MTGLFIMMDVLVALTLFAKTYGWTTGDEYIYSVARMPGSGGFALAGTTNSYGAGGTDALLVVLTSDGKNIQWAKAYGGANNDGAWSVICTDDGGFVIAGYTESFGAGSRDMLVLRLDQDGNISWAKTFGTSGWEEARSVIETPGVGGYAVGGSDNSNILLLKLTAAGNESWAKSYNTRAQDVFMTQTYDDGYVFTGEYIDFTLENATLLLVLNPDGSVGRAKAFYGMVDGNHSIFDVGLSVVPTSDGGFAITGATDPDLADIPRLMVIRTNSLGNLSWAKTTTGVQEIGNSIIQTADEGFVVVGKTKILPPFGDEAQIMKFSSADGSLFWTKTFNALGWERAFSVLQLPDGSLAIAGTTFDFNQRDGFLLRTAADGTYSGCVLDQSPGLVTPTFATSNLSVSPSPWTHSTGTPGISVTPPITPLSVNICAPVYESVDETAGFDAEVICFPVSHALIFNATAEAELKIYSPDGRLSSSTHLIAGQTRIPLDPGVYLWQAGPYKGKAVVR
ncbi:MAG: hypothetical protein ABIM74_00860 [candidate division WOR-3 bacterium]